MKRQDETQAETLMISFSDLKNRDVQREDLKIEGSSEKTVSYDVLLKAAESSFFRNVYQQALEQIAMIVQQNCEQVSDQLYKHDIQNIIAFTGRRGTGKTSAMMSLAEFLSNHELEIKSPADGATKKDTVAFKLLAEIDATSLDRNVSLIPMILSQLITRLNNEMYCSNCRRRYSETEKHADQEIYKTANQLFTDYITGNHPSSKAVDASNYLSIASKRLSFEKSFREMIKKYSENNNGAYFIICIDDVDMAPCDHAKLLISIHQYLMIPNIIVMLTANLKFLAPEIQTLFYRNAIPANDKLAVERLSSEQTEEYLKKIVPSDNRITLPSWKKKDYLDIFPIKVSFYDASAEKESIEKSVEKIKLLFNKLESSEFFSFIDEQSEKKPPEPYSITPKELILMMIANRTKVYLDVCGMKYHFFEPSSLRNMYDLFYILYNMNNIVEKYDQRDSNDYYLERSQNRKRLLDYIHFTMRRDYRFDAQTSEFLDELIAYPIERRGQKIWGYYYQLLDSEGISKRIDSAYGTGFRPSEKYFFMTEKYSLGEFFRILYTSSRIGVFDHKFIKFILASYSMALPAFVENEKRKRDQEDGHYKQLAALFGSSLIGTTWCDELFGSLVTANSLKQIFDDVVNNTKIYTDPIVQYQAKRCSIDVSFSQEAVKVRELEKLISLLLLSPHWVTEKTIKVENNGSQFLIHAELDPTSFLINCLLIDDKISDHYDKDGKLLKEGLRIFAIQGFETKLTIAELIKEMCGEHCKIDCDDLGAEGPSSSKKAIANYASYCTAAKEIADKKKDIGKPISISTAPNAQKTIVEVILDYLAEDYRAQHLSNMLKHIDLTYNTIKRSITDIVYITSHDVVKKPERFKNAGEPASIIADFYTKLIKQLKDTDKVYFAKGTEADYSFATRFETSAIVKNVRSMAGCSDSKLCLKADEIKEASDNQDKTTDNQDKTATLKKIFDDILPIHIYIDYESDFMFALRGQLADLLDNYLSLEQVKRITAIIMKSFNEIAVGSLDTGDNKDVNAIVLDEIDKAKTKITEILDE